MGYTRYARLDNLTIEEGVSITSDTVMLSISNTVMFTGNVTITGNVLKLFTLPEEERPIVPIKIPVCTNSGVQIMNIGVDGSCEISSYATEVYLNGVSFNIAGNFYNTELGTGTYEASTSDDIDGDIS